MQDILENRRYIGAIQDTTKYMEAYGLNKGINNEFISYTDINFSPIGIPRTIYKAIYKKLNSITGINMIEARDDNSMESKKDILHDLRTKAKLKDALQDITGIDITGGAYVPENDIELDVFAQMGGIALPVEVVLQETLKEVDQVNKFDNEIRPQINNDIICGSLPVVHTYFDESGLIKEEAIDVMSLKIIGGSKRDFSDADGFIVKIKLPAQDVYNAIKEYHGEIKEGENSDNAVMYDRALQSLKQKTGMIDINICYWSAYDHYTKQVKDDGVKNRSNKKDGLKTKVEKKFQAWNVDGTDIIYNHGPVPNMIRERVLSKYGKAYWPLTVLRVDPIYKEVNSSPISIIKKFEDMAVSAWLKLQNELSNARPSGREYNLTAMKNALELVAFENLQESLDYANKTGDVYTADGNGFDEKPTGPAFRDIKGGLSSAFQEYMAIMDFCVRWSRDIAGTPAIETGAEQNYRVSNFVTKGLLSGSDNAMAELLETKLYLLQILAEKKLNMILRYAHPSSEIDFPYKTELSEVKNYVLENIERGSTVEIGLRVEQDLTTEEIDKLKAELIALSQIPQNGGITPIEYLHFTEMLKTNAKYAAFMLATMQDKRLRQAKQDAADAQAQNAADQANAAQINNEGKANIEAIKGQNKSSHIQQEKDLDLRNSAVQHGLQAGAGMVTPT